MDIGLFMKESFIESFRAVFTIAKIVIPMMIVIEILKDYKVLDKISDKLRPIAKLFNISKKSTLPLVIGLVLGLAYGAGVIIKAVNEGNLKKKDLYLVIIFLVCCHSVLEDTLVFVAVGANGWFLITVRLLTAIIFTFIVAKNIDKILKNNKEMS
ncbi:nucleoside recognition domain-containing protein [Clostridiisalibacter paucivorans]|uniref:nucleoside recognition domain-containing protein n=1 Tax=Clostridiisalibacter paucivorans TaxID=408753 RepID=UPI000AF1CAEB|nr:nucleoside recognition domain-containing protein [Clostridiisalibacter paucivorans]